MKKQGDRILKRFGRLLLCFAIAIGMLVTACACDNSKPIDFEETTAGADTNDTTEDVEEVKYEDKTVTERYLPKSVRAYYVTALSVKSDKFKYCLTDHSMHALQDVYTVSNCKLNTLSIAVYKTGAKDANGNLVFTLFVHDNSFNGLKMQAKRQYQIKIKPEDYGLSANQTVMKFVDIDVREYGITLAKNETLAMFAATDTIFPVRVTVADTVNWGTEQNEVALPLVDNFPQAQSFYTKVGTANLTYNASMFVLYDFEWEKTYTAEEQKAAADLETEYQALKALLAEKYKGKNVSILGDSISTFAGIANNTQYNATIGDNLMYHTHSTNPHKWEMTYWGRLITDLDMNLCVNNSWASGRVYGRPNGKINSGSTVDLNYRDSAPMRATELDREDGTTPDLIIVYMGINDLHSNGTPKVPFGDLYALLKNANADQYNAVIEQWFASVLQKTANGSALTAGTTYTSFEQAYALALYRMKEKYSGVEILCMGLENNASAAFSTEKQAQFNLVIKALAQYFGAIYVDQTGAYSEITPSNMHALTMDTGCTHLNSMGHAATERMILRTLADALKKNNQ